jgi:hypothetical protein
VAWKEVARLQWDRKRFKIKWNVNKVPDYSGGGNKMEDYVKIGRRCNISGMGRRCKIK